MTKQWIESKFRRTNSWQSQPEFDKMLGGCTISGLQFLYEKYEKEVNNFKETHDLSIDENFAELKEKQQRLKMIDDEIEHRWTDIWASPTYYGQTRYTFDATTGLVCDADGIPVFTMDFNEDETGYIQRDLEGAVIEYYVMEEEMKIGDLSRKDIYKGWDYFNEIEVEE